MQNFQTIVIISNMEVQNLEITPGNILSVVVKLPENEFEDLFSDDKNCVETNLKTKLIKKLS